MLQSDYLNPNRKHTDLSRFFGILFSLFFEFSFSLHYAEKIVHLHNSVLIPVPIPTTQS